MLLQERGASAAHHEAARLQVYPQQWLDTVPAYFGNRGQCYLKLSDWKAALADSMKAVEIDAAFGKGWIRAGICHIRMGEFEQAKECFKKAVAIKVCPKVLLLLSRSELRAAFSFHP